MRRWSIVGTLLVIGCSSPGEPLALRITPPPLRPATLHGPYRLRPPAGPRAPAPELRSPPAPVHDVMGVSYYTDAHRSEIDPALKAQNEAEEAPMHELGRIVNALSDAYLEGGGTDPALAIRTVDALYAWASADAMLGRVNRNGLYQTQWALCAYALDYLKVRDDPALDPAKKARVAGWFRALAARLVAYADRFPRWPDHANNHAYWAGLAMAAAGVASDDRALFDRGVAQFRIFLREVRPDGTLPRELARGKRALHYQLFAVAPLVMLAELAEANGVHLYEAGDHALARAVDRALAGLDDPAAFGAVAGAVQLVPGRSDLAWLELWEARFPSARGRRWLDPRPLVSGFLGGDLTLAFGAR
jgi:poly(beta-D-mannuronate) lyase